MKRADMLNDVFHSTTLATYGGGLLPENAREVVFKYLGGLVNKRKTDKKSARPLCLGNEANKLVRRLLQRNIIIEKK